MKNSLLALLSLISFTAVAQDFSRNEVSNLTTELVMELHVNIGAGVSIGDSDLGERRYAPITGTITPAVQEGKVIIRVFEVQ